MPKIGAALRITGRPETCANGHTSRSQCQQLTVLFLALSWAMSCRVRFSLSNCAWSSSQRCRENGNHALCFSYQEEGLSLTVVCVASNRHQSCCASSCKQLTSTIPDARFSPFALHGPASCHLLDVTCLHTTSQSPRFNTRMQSATDTDYFPKQMRCARTLTTREFVICSRGSMSLNARLASYPWVQHGGQTTFSSVSGCGGSLCNVPCHVSEIRCAAANLPLLPGQVSSSLCPCLPPHPSSPWLCP